MTVPEPVKRTRMPRPFTTGAWLVWAIIPVVPFSLFGLLDFYVKVTYGSPDSPHDGGPGLVMGMVVVGLFIMIVTVPIIGLIQWLILRRPWANPLLLPGWFCAILMCLVASFLFFATPWVAPLQIALLPTILLALVSPPGLRFRVFSVLLFSFAAGAVLPWTMLHNHWPNLRFLKLYQWTPDAIGAELALQLCLSIIAAAAVSGIGLWIASRWIANLTVEDFVA